MDAAAPARDSHIHEALLYDSDDALLSLVVPFLQAGLDAAEPTLVVVNDRTAELLATAVGRPGLVFLDPPDRRHDPASRIRDSRRIITAHVTRGAAQVRLLGEIPHPGHGSPWDWWARYEAAVNHVYAEFPLWNVCPYDLRITPVPVLDDVTSTHPWLTTGAEPHAANSRYQDPTDFLTHRPPTAAGELETTGSPLFELVDPALSAARGAVRACGELTSGIDVEDAALCVSEAVTNAVLHGAPPVRVRLWAAADRLVATVSDAGVGPADPFVGLLPTSSADSAGLGLWMAHQMCSHLTFDRTGGQFTVRLVFDAAG